MTMTRPALPSKKMIAEFWQGRETPWGGYIDDDPSCMACGYFRPRTLDSRGWKTWNDAKGLERCHIIPHALGGSSECDNLVLMCRRCHEHSPDTADPDTLFTWMKECPKSIFDTHWSEVPLWHALSDNLLKNNDAQSAIWMSMCFHQQTRLMQSIGENLNVGIHFGQMSIGSKMAVMRKTIESLSPDMTQQTCEHCTNLNGENQ